MKAPSQNGTEVRIKQNNLNCIFAVIIFMNVAVVVAAARLLLYNHNSLEMFNCTKKVLSCEKQLGFHQAWLRSALVYCCC